MNVPTACARSNKRNGADLKKYYLANLPAQTDSRTLAEARCEQAHQQLKEELGLDHFEADPGKDYSSTH